MRRFIRAAFYICTFMSILNSHLCGTLLEEKELEEKEVLFLSTPRSGTHWALYCLCDLLNKQPIMNRGTKQADILGDVFIANTGGFIYAAHNPRNLWVKKDGYNHDILVLIVRNYRESMKRNFGTVIRILQNIDQQARLQYLDHNVDSVYDSPQEDLINNLRCYDFWSHENRFLIYYEDLIQNPASVLYELAKFFKVEEPELKINAFIDQLDFHINKCLKIYEKQGGSKSGGKDLLYHSKVMGLTDCKRIDEKLQTLFPYYFERYLSRYLTNDSDFN